MTIRLNEDALSHARGLLRGGDFKRLHRCAVISGESRAAQYKHPSIEKACRELIDALDRKKDG